MTPQTAPLEKHQAHVRYSAGEYDQYTAGFVKRFDEIMASRVLEEAALRPDGALLLDIGTGTARFLLYLCGLQPLDDLRIVGADVFPDMIDQATQTVADAGLQDRIALVVDDVHAMNLPDDYADIVTSRSTIHHWHTPIQAFKEIYRVLKPGGIAMIHDVRRDPAPEAINEFNRLRAQAGLPPSFLEEKFTAAEIEDFLRQAGIGEYSKVYNPPKGIMALGFGVEISKPAA
jgi:ubiquinone/menaquinone biosynthesis C-methylase UbiE